MSRKKKEPTLNYEFMRDAHINSLKEAYEKYKREMKKGIDMTWISDNGGLCVYGDGNQKNIDKAKQELLDVYDRYKEFIIERDCIQSETSR